MFQVKLLELVSELDYTTIHYVTGNQEFQDRIICDILFTLLKDENQRVRSACSQAIVR